MKIYFLTSPVILIWYHWHFPTIFAKLISENLDNSLQDSPTRAAGEKKLVAVHRPTALLANPVASPFASIGFLLDTTFFPSSTAGTSLAYEGTFATLLISSNFQSHQIHSITSNYVVLQKLFGELFGYKETIFYVFILSSNFSIWCAQYIRNTRRYLRHPIEDIVGGCFFYQNLYFWLNVS